MARPCVGEWTVKQYDGYVLLKYCKAYWNPNNGAVKEPVLWKKDDERKGGVPVYDRYFVKDGSLYSCSRVRGAGKEDEGLPGTLLYDCGTLDLGQVMALIDEGTWYDWSRYSSKPPKARVPKERIMCQGRDISKEFDGQSVMAVMALRDKWTYMYIENAVKHEGGTIDENGIIHKAQ